MSELTEDNRGPRRLRQLLAGPEPVVAPGAYDALSARVVEQAGFDAVYMTGFGASASLLGRPDVGLLSFGEMVDQARRLVAGSRRAGHRRRRRRIRQPDQRHAHGPRVRGRRAWPALHLEDQVSPKRCGHMEGKQVIAASEMVEKIRAAVEARRSEDLVIIARTDARAVEGLDAALERAAALPRRRRRRAVRRGAGERGRGRGGGRGVPGHAAAVQRGRGRPHAAARARAPARARLPSRALPAHRAPRGHRRRSAGARAAA